MKIGLVGYEANVANRVGSNQYAFEIIWSLYRIDRHNHYIIYLPAAPLSDLPPARDTWQYRVGGPDFMWSFFGLPKMIWETKPEVVFNPGHYAPFLRIAPLVISIMDVGFVHFPEQFTRGTFLKLKWWTARSLRICDAAIAISESTKKDVVGNYQIPQAKISVTYPGYDKNKFHYPYPEQRIKEIKNKYGLNQEYLLFLGTLKPSKNILGLIEAFEIVSQKLKNVNLVIAGRKGWMYREIYARAEKVGLQRKIIFTDFVSDDDIAALVAGAKVFVLPSFWEGFGIPVVEAMASGVPVVVSDSGSLPEVVGRSGVVVDPNNPASIARGIIDAFSESKKWQRLGLARAAEFSWEKCGKATLAILEKFAKKG